MSRNVQEAKPKRTTPATKAEPKQLRLFSAEALSQVSKEQARWRRELRFRR